MDTPDKAIRTTPERSDGERVNLLGLTHAGLEDYFLNNNRNILGMPGFSNVFFKFLSSKRVQKIYAVMIRFYLKFIM